MRTYSPNLNLIERLWRFMKKNVTYNKYFEKFAVFRIAITRYLETIDHMGSQLRGC
jgi:transposase